MPIFKVELHRPVRKSYHGMPEPNPFLAALPSPGRKSNWIVRSWTFEAKDEAEVKKLLGEAYGSGIEGVNGFTLRSIERVALVKPLIQHGPDCACTGCNEDRYYATQATSKGNEI